MPINFPNSPTPNQRDTYDNKTWEWNGTYWEVYSALTSYITSAYTVGDGVSDISGVTGGNIVLKSFSGVNITIIDGGDKLTFSGYPQQNVVGFYLPLSGGTVTGGTIFQGGLTATTISATTYYNLPVSAVTSGTGISASTSNGTVTITNTSPDRTVIITGGTNIQIVSSYPNFGVNFTGGTILKYFVTGSTPSGVINDGDRWFNTNDGVELVRITDGDGSQWIQPNNGGSNSGSTSSPSITGTGTSNTVTKWANSSGLTDSIITDDGTTVTVNGKQKITGSLTYETSLSTYGASGEFFYFGGGSTTTSQTYYYDSSGNWSSTDATSSGSSIGLISIAVGSNPTSEGMLSKGYYVLDYGSFTTGDRLYISDSTPGQLTSVAPTTSGYIVRVVGYVIDGGSRFIYFCPDNTWIELV